MVFHVPESQADAVAAWLEQQLSAPHVSHDPEGISSHVSRASRGVPPVTGFWLGVIVVSGLWLLAGFSEPWDWMIVDPRWWDVDSPGARWLAILETLGMGEVWRLISPVWLHFSLEHGLFNMLALYILGGPLERYLGSVRLMASIIAIGVVSNVLQALTGPITFGGFSGINYGLMGMVWVLKRSDEAGHFAGIPTSLIYFSVFFAFLGLTGMTDAVGLNMADTAHFSGLATGSVLGVLFRTKKGGKAPESCEVP
ncbi:rhomboid family intramembrane serine protease [Hahella sp. SMD15-11]|uniref:Rhomboid family intramembrane serine protease n=1 Tax=Thermohahella caldifontis TaxID=3142973 RepID=A0AB39UZ57_9GAMM